LLDRPYSIGRRGAKVPIGKSSEFSLEQLTILCRICVGRIRPGRVPSTPKVQPTNKILKSSLVTTYQRFAVLQIRGWPSVN
jgi:hypothetical protein